MAESAKESVSERVPTPDEQKGMDWWSAMTEPQRAYWLKRAASAVPADAWRAYCAERDIADILSREPRRVFSGVEIDGFEFLLRVYPRVDGLMSVQLTSSPPSTFGRRLEAEREEIPTALTQASSLPESLRRVPASQRPHGSRHD